MCRRRYVKLGNSLLRIKEAETFFLGVEFARYKVLSKGLPTHVQHPGQMLGWAAVDLG